MADLNPFASFAQGRQLRMARNAEERLEEDRAREAGYRNRMAGLLAGGIPATPEGQQTVVAETARYDPGAALDWSKHFASQKPDLLERRKAEAPAYVAELQNVTDQATYDQARANLANLGVDAGDMPDVYDPKQVNMMMQASRYLAEGPAEPARAGPFEGTGLQAQAHNILLTKDPSSPEYAAAYGIVSQPRTYLDQGSGQIVTVQPDVSAYAAPGRAAQPVAAKEPPAPIGQAGQPAPKVRQTGGMQVTPIPGSKAAREAEKEAEAKESREAQKKAYARVVTQDIDRIFDLMEDADLPVTGFVGSRVAAIPGTAAHDIASLLDTVRANIGFDRLQQMRAASPTGGALGQVSEMENRLLQATFGALNQSQTEEQFSRNLTRLKDYYSKIVLEGMSPAEIEAELAKLEGRDAEEAPTAAGIARPQSKAEYDALPVGTRYMAPDGSERTKQ